MAKNKIVDGTNDPTLATWINRFTKEYGSRPTRMADLAAFVEQNQQWDKRDKASGQIARHDPERMARAERAGEIIGHVTCCGFNALDEHGQNFIIGILAAVHDGKA